MNTKHCNRPSGLHSDASWFDYLALAVMMLLCAAILLGAIDGMLTDTVAPITGVLR